MVDRSSGLPAAPGAREPLFPARCAIPGAAGGTSWGRLARGLRRSGRAANRRLRVRWLFHPWRGVLLSVACGVHTRAAEPAGAETRPERPALIVAVERGQRSLVERLLQEGADLNARTPDGVTPLYAAAFHGRTEILRLLLAAGAEVNGRTALFTAAAEGQVGAVAFGDGSLIATAAHCVDDFLEVRRRSILAVPLVFSPYRGEVFEAEIVGVDAAADLAILKVRWGGTPPCRWPAGGDPEGRGDARSRLRPSEQPQTGRSVELGTRLAREAPDRAAYWFHFAGALRSVGRNQAALEAAKRLCALPAKEQSWYRGRLAELLARCGRLAEAEACHRELLEQSPASAVLWLWYAQFLAECMPERREDLRKALDHANPASSSGHPSSGLGQNCAHEVRPASSPRSDSSNVASETAPAPDPQNANAANREAAGGRSSTANDGVDAVDPGWFGGLLIRPVDSLTGLQNEPFIGSDRLSALPTRCLQKACQHAAEGSPNTTSAHMHQRLVNIGSYRICPAFLSTDRTLSGHTSGAPPRHAAPDHPRRCAAPGRSRPGGCRCPGGARRSRGRRCGCCPRPAPRRGP